MCGIAGFFGHGERDDLLRMVRAQFHRGPDDEGIYIDPARPVFLGQRRLAIRDAEGGKQPMWSEDGTIGVVYNGEIYNHVELRRELEDLGYIFRSSHSDTEVLVHGYRAWGDALPERLNGMFAFSVYDQTRRRFLLARDRFGEKPLYYFHGKGLFAFASELSALLAHSRIEAAPNPAALRKLFAWGYIPAPDALYEKTFKLKAGHLLTYDLTQNEPVVRSYWRFRLEPDEDVGARPEADLVEELQQLLFQAVARRLVSDVPLGMFLSGGIDSSLILAAVAKQHGDVAVDAFTIGFEEPSYDESEYARCVADHLGVTHHLRTLSIEQARDLMPAVLDRLDEPLGDASILPTYMVSAFAREHVTVALSGDGGDELFAGYDPFDALGPAALYSRLVPRPVHAMLRVLVHRLPISTANMSFDFKLRRTLMGLSLPVHAWAPAWMAPLAIEELNDLFAAPVTVEEVYGDAIGLWENCASADPADRLMEFFTVFYLQNDILAKTDRAAMMNSLETRAVFLDNDVVEFCRKLPRRYKYRARQRKYLLRKAAENLLPRAIIDRPKKGFGIPLSQWLRSVPAAPPMSPVPGISSANVTDAWRSHRAGQSDQRLFLFTWLSLQHVLQKTAQLKQAFPQHQ